MDFGQNDRISWISAKMTDLFGPGPNNSGVLKGRNLPDFGLKSANLPDFGLKSGKFG